VILETPKWQRGEHLTIKEWLHERSGRVANQWKAEMRDRDGRHEDEGHEILGNFVQSLPVILSGCLGENREAGEDVWEQATHLYGALALLRGLSAGEVVEELQLLRKVLLKLLLEDPPGDWRDRGFQREILFLNRLIDQGVVGASVAYVDDLFFAQLQGSGIPGGVTPEVEYEMGRQLKVFERESGVGG
jgi:hypothetical protein